MGKCNHVQVKVGDLMAIVHYVKVKQKSYDRIIVDNVDDGVEYQVIGHQLIDNLLSADQFEQEERVTKTRAAEILVGLVNQPFTAAFEKMDGSERVLRGRLVAPEPLLGRSMVEDLDEPRDSKRGRMRQVDHRTLRFIICNNVKYVVKP